MTQDWQVSWRILSKQTLSYGYGSKLGTPKLWMINTKLDIHICGPTSVFHFDPHPYVEMAVHLSSGWCFLSRMDVAHNRRHGPSIQLALLDESTTTDWVSRFFESLRFRETINMYLNPICSYLLEYESQHLSHQWPSFVGKYTSTMVRIWECIMYRISKSAWLDQNLQHVFHFLCFQLNGFGWGLLPAIRTLATGQPLVDLTTPERCVSNWLDLG